MNYQAYRTALDVISAGFVSAVGSLIRQFFRTDMEYEARADFVEQALPVVMEYRRRAYEAGVDFIYAEADRVGVDVPESDLPAIREYDATILNIAVNRETASTTTPDQLVASLERHVEVSGKQVISDLADPPPHMDEEVYVGDSPEAVEGDVALTDEQRAEAKQIIEAKPTEPTKDRGRYQYARVLTGRDNCSFCVMAATRGAVYGTARAAGDSGKYPNETWHTRCDCVAVPVFEGNMQDAAKVAALRNLWETAQDEGEADGTVNDMLNNLRQYLTHNAVEIPSLAN